MESLLQGMIIDYNIKSISSLPCFEMGLLELLGFAQPHILVPKQNGVFTKCSKINKTHLKQNI